MPTFVRVYRFWKRHFEARRLRRLSPEEIFTQIFRENRWGGRSSVSGVGSDPVQTRVITHELPRVLRRYSVTRLLDIPCGDFAWMQRVDLAGIVYIGADIVADLVERNTQAFGRSNVSFQKLDLLVDPLPTADLVLCRDCLMHLSARDVILALRNICSSGAKYLLTSTFPGRKNWDIATGQMRPINLEARPFLLPKPLLLINEDYTDEGGAYRDKSLGLWEVAAVDQALFAQP